MMRNGLRGFGGGYGFYGPWMIGVEIVKFVIFIALVILVVYLFKKYNNGDRKALAILNERFSRGEIDEEEYLRRKAALKK